jgi:hypothetical protein
MTPTETFPSPLRRGLPALLAAAALAVIVAGCGGSSPPSASVSGSAASGKPGADAYQFANCMRNHGVSSFPDPVVKVSGNSASVAIHITPTVSGSPAFKTAQKACAHILPGPNGNGNGLSPAQQQARTRALVAFAQCLRTHGFPHFPDPNAQGDLSLQTVQAAGIDIHTPALLTAGKACTSVTHGQITPADVVRAINGPH